MNNIGWPKIEIKEETTSQPMHDVRERTIILKKPQILRDEQGRPIPKLLKMAGENTSSTSHQSVATYPQSDDRQRVICYLCNQHYNDPRLLDCLHSFCLKCLDKPEVYKSRSEKQRILRCPDCYQDTVVPPMGVSDLCKDIITTKLVKKQEIKQQLLSQGPHILCQACDEKHFAVAHCLHCNEFLCMFCKMAHQRLIKMKSHILVTLEDLRSGKVDVKGEKVDMVHKCRHHADQDLCMFCITCQEMICLMCTALTHCKPDHAFVDIKTAAASCRSEILEVLTPLKVDVKELQNTKTSAEQAKQKLEYNVTELHDKIHKKKKSESEKLTRRATILTDKAESVVKQRGKVLDKCLMVANKNVIETEFILEKVTSIVSDGDCHDIITLKEKVLKNLNRVSLKKAESVPLDLSFMDFAESSTSGNNLGELVLEEKWTLKEEFGSNSVPACNFEWAKTVVARSNGDIVVLDSGSKRVMILTSMGVHKDTIPTYSKNPIRIALSTSENILVLDSVVKEYDKDGIFISRQALPEGVTSAKCIDAGSGKIAIGTKDMILLFDEDGSNQISIPAKLIDKHIAICSKTQSLIYTNYEMSRLVSVEFSGREKFNVSTVIKAKTVKPAGICTDKTGDIYIAVHTGMERGTGEIHHYSPEGCYIGSVATNLYNPIGLFFSPIGELIVADRHSVKVFLRV